MGSMLKFDSERRELVRERRDARIERKQQRRQARAHKHSHTAETLFTPSATQVLAERELQAAVDRIVMRRSSATSRWRPRQPGPRTPRRLRARCRHRHARRDR